MTVELSKTSSSNIVFIPPFNGKCGALALVSFSVEKCSDPASNFFEIGSFSLISDVYPSKHGYIFNDENTDQPQVFKDLREVFEHINDHNGVIYQLPEGVDADESLLTLVKMEKACEWFESDDPFLSIFIGLHKLKRNDPTKFIFTKP